jgi:hypothetical protein
MCMSEEKIPRPKQKPIHYLVYITIGLLMSLISKIILLKDNSEHSEAMRLFFYIGLLFLAIGIIKLALKKYNKLNIGEKESAFAESLAGRDAKALAMGAAERSRYESNIHLPNKLHLDFHPEYA